MEEIAMQQIPPSDHAAVNTATEIAFNALMRSASAGGVSLDPVMGLMYLPDPAVTQQFQQACRAVIDSLRPKGDT